MPIPDLLPERSRLDPTVAAIDDGDVDDVDEVFDTFDICACTAASVRRAASLGPVTLTLALCFRDNDTVRATATSGAAVWLVDVGGFMAIGFGLGLDAGGTVFSNPCNEDGSVVDREPRTRVEAERAGSGLLLVDEVCDWDSESVLDRPGRVGFMPACSILVTVLLVAYFDRGMNLESFRGTGGGLSSAGPVASRGGACAVV